MVDCRSHERTIDEHFRGRGSIAAQQAMRTHVVDCPSCRARYQRWLHATRFDPDALSAQQRLGRGLGLAAVSPGQSRWRWSLAPLLAVAACLVLVLVRPLQGGFVERGRALQSDFSAYVLRPDHPPVHLERRMQTDDRLAFAYRNPEGFRRLAIFAIDAGGSVRWYYPRWDDASSDPETVPIETSDRTVELGEAVRHPLPKGPLHLFALFGREPTTVRALEARIATTAGRPLASRDERIIELPIDVSP